MNLYILRLPIAVDYVIFYHKSETEINHTYFIVVPNDELQKTRRNTKVYFHFYKEASCLL